MMSERSHESIANPLHFARCMYQLGVLSVREIVHKVKMVLDDDAWPDDSPEDAAIKSEVFNQKEVI
jgi:hypothetical protein